MTFYIAVMLLHYSMIPGKTIDADFDTPQEACRSATEAGSKVVVEVFIPPPFSLSECCKLNADIYHEGPANTCLKEPHVYLCEAPKRSVRRMTCASSPEYHLEPIP